MLSEMIELCKYQPGIGCMLIDRARPMPVRIVGRKTETNHRHRRKCNRSSRRGVYHFVSNRRLSYHWNLLWICLVSVELPAKLSNSLEIAENCRWFAFHRAFLHRKFARLFSKGMSNIVYLRLPKQRLIARGNALCCRTDSDWYRVFSFVAKYSTIERVHEYFRGYYCWRLALVISRDQSIPLMNLNYCHWHWRLLQSKRQRISFWLGRRAVFTKNSG